MPMHKDTYFSWRACLTGLFLSLLVIVADQFSVNIIRGSFLTIDHMPAGGIFIFFLLVLFINPILYKINKSLQFSYQELILIYTMLLVSCSISTMGLCSQLCPIIAMPYYYATPENRWAQIIQPHLKPWLVPHGEKTIQYFFEGLPKGMQVPWLAWILPLISWFILILSLYVMMICINVILRKQWVDREKLIYPLTRLPLEMIQTDGKSILSPFFKNKLMWLGFAIPFLISSWNGVHHYFHFIPQIQLANDIEIFQKTIFFYFRISFPIIGFTYLINQEVALGLWVFNLLFTLIQGGFNITGISSTENVGIYGIRDPIFAHLGTGAFFAYVLLGLWIARGHLKDVFIKAFSRSSAKKNLIDDSQEMISYKSAVWCLIISSLIALLWLVTSGMGVMTAITFMIFGFIFWIGLTKIISESGIPTIIPPSIASSQTISSLGGANIGDQGLTSLGMTYPYSSDMRTFPMSAVSQGLKLSSNDKAKKRFMFWAIILVIAVTFIAANFITLKLAYTYGGANLNKWFFIEGAKRPSVFIAQQINAPSVINQLGWGCRIIGAVIMGALILVRYNFLWWPLHPIGFAVGGVSWIGQLWFSIFLVWLIKWVMLKYGGNDLYRKGTPFFLGLVLGQYSAACIWFLIDVIAGGTGNTVFWI
ncbi:MAG: hypothetical protein A3J83_02675 [Elusimicrobia bacterium RIFOXYA2_FULL_40_6]|nr:MAG: hypothetical protein A3J83_02675 [Elusimicrobia bacterium RIFOXYA2_FULL_40_6]